MMVYQYGSQLSPQGARKSVVIVSTDIANLKCTGQEKGTSTVYLIDLTTSVGVFSHNPAIGEEWVITQIQGLWSLERKTSLQNVAIPAVQASSPGDTVFNAAGNLIIASTDVELQNGAITSTWKNNGVNSYITDNDPSVEHSATTTTTGTVGGRAYTCIVKTFITYDRLCEVTYSITIAAGSTAGTYVFTNALPAGTPDFPSPALPRASAIFVGGWVSNVGSGFATTNAAAGQIAVFGSLANTTNISGSFLYTISKPTF